MGHEWHRIDTPCIIETNLQHDGTDVLLADSDPRVMIIPPTEFQLARQSLVVCQHEVGQVRYSFTRATNKGEILLATIDLFRIHRYLSEIADSTLDILLEMSNHRSLLVRGLELYDRCTRSVSPESIKTEIVYGFAHQGLFYSDPPVDVEQEEMGSFGLLRRLA